MPSKKKTAKKKAPAKKAVLKKKVAPKKKAVVSKKKMVAKKKIVAKKKPAAKKKVVAKKKVATKKKLPAKKKTVAKKAPVAKKKAAIKKKAVAKKVVAPKKKVEVKKKVTAKKVEVKKKVTTKKVAKAKKKKTARKKMTPKQIAERKEARLQAEREAAAIRVQAVAEAAAAKKKKMAVIIDKNIKLSPFVKLQQQKLLALRDALIGQMSGMARDTLRAPASGGDSSAFGMHQADAGSDAYDRDFVLNLLSQEQDAFHEVEEALTRIARGVYGLCEISGKKIPQPRLLAIPFARYTVACQEELEKQEEQGQVRQPVGPLFGNSDTEGVAKDVPKPTSR
ncbi:MAG: TraR/DksA family transcriptional regulator [Verrucomicrobiales bacterium]|nr:TraR/DksA family transcriptional regulator [Verrucomicrobiales bacterium]